MSDDLRIYPDEERGHIAYRSEHGDMTAVDEGQHLHIGGGWLRTHPRPGAPCRRLAPLVGRPTRLVRRAVTTCWCHPATDRRHLRRLDGNRRRMRLRQQHTSRRLYTQHHTRHGIPLPLLLQRLREGLDAGIPTNEKGGSSVRIRSTKPEFWRSKRIASVDWDARLVLKALESYVDDNGVGKYDLELLVGDTFSRDVIRDPSGTLMRVQACVGTLLRAGLLWKYEDDGQELIYVSFWESTQYIQRPAKGRLRRPDGTSDYGESKIGAPNHENSGALMSPPSLIRGTGDQGTGDQGSCASADAERDGDDIDAEFNEWWEAYPRKRGKGQALTAYRKARKQTEANTLLEAAKAQAPVLVQKGMEFVPYPATWLNGERWNDEFDTPSPSAGSESNSFFDRPFKVVPNE